METQSKRIRVYDVPAKRDGVYFVGVSIETVLKNGMVLRKNVRIDFVKRPKVGDVIKIKDITIEKTAKGHDRVTEIEFA